jgi:hypothetical protein
MSDHMRGNHDPSRDEWLARILRAAGGTVPYESVHWSRLRSNVLRRAAERAAPGWWDVMAGWSRLAAAASIAAMLLSALLYWRAAPVSSLPDSVAAAPESVAIARVATAYPDEPAFASLVQVEHRDEFTTLGLR